MRLRRSPTGARRGEPTRPRRTGGAPWGPLALLVAAVAYDACFIWKTSFLIGTRRYFSLFDDAMISMRYGRNLAHGLGLVWNPGEPPIEGFSNPLWTVVMAALHWLPLPPHRLSLAVQSLGVLVLAASLVLVDRLAARLAPTASPGAASGARRGPDATAATPDPAGLGLAAMTLAAFCYPLVYWTLVGMEVGLLALIVAAAAVTWLSGRRLGWTYALLAVGTWVRLDFAVVLAGFIVAGVALDPGRRGRHLRVGATALVLALGSQTVARLLYFHDLLPNTYYLKLTGYPLALRCTRGAWVLLQAFAGSHGLMALLPLLGVWLARGESRRRMLAMLIPAAAVCAYSAWVGGDAWEGTVPWNRYLSVVMPLLLVASAWPIAALAARLAGSGGAARVVAVALALATVLASYPYPATLLLEPPPYVHENADLTCRGLAARDLTRPDARVAAAAVGAIGYYSERPIVDLLGKNDRHIARLPMRRPVATHALTAFHPGHLKWDYAYSIGVLQPDLVAQLWLNPHEADAYLARDYDAVDVVSDARRFHFAVRRGSPRVRSPETRGQP